MCLLKIFGIVSCLPFALLLLIGCRNSISTDYHKLDLGEVNGTITFDGKPLANAHVVFQSPQNADFSTGRTDNLGRYTMMFNSEKAGVLAGQQIVRIRKRRFSERDYIRFRNSILSNDSDQTELQTDDEPGDDGEAVSDFESTNPGAGDEPRKNPDELPTVYHDESQLKVSVEKRSQSINFDLKSDGSTTGPS